MTTGIMFSSEEMEAIREEYVRRIEELEGTIEELEWRVKMAEAKSGEFPAQAARHIPREPARSPHDPAPFMPHQSAKRARPKTIPPLPLRALP